MLVKNVVRILVDVLIMGLFLEVACGGNGATPRIPDVLITQHDGKTNTGQDQYQFIDSDAGRGDGRISADIPTVSDTAGEVLDTAPAKGRLGYPCDSNTDCQSGICLDTAKGKVCTEFCMESCPSGWACKDISWAGDTVFVCLPRFSTLCDPCNTPSDCNPPMSAGNAACIDTGGNGSFCGGDCADSDCPDGYVCKKVSVPGGVSKQCVPKSGKCKCSKSAILRELSTKCYIQNKAGKCMGERKCLATGLSDCDAKTPKPEECNKIDDNCNGLTDEGLDKVPCKNSNDYGTCSGTAKCVDGQVIGCDAPTPKPEKCDGFDNNCDGNTDENTCFDGNPCTEDKCDPSQGKCVYAPLSGAPCDDGNKCTEGDHCESGKCVAGMQKNCDDNNPCTDDICDPNTGKCTHVNNHAKCEDGNPCTVNDYCESGQCQPGTPKACKDAPPCKTSGKCNPQTGQCEYTYNDGLICDDGNRCTSNDKCSGGKCVGGQVKQCQNDPPCKTDGKCDPATGQCTYKLNDGAPCEDGNPCTINDKCSGGYCKSGAHKQCPDDPPCKTFGYCDSSTGQCKYTYNDNWSCDDGNKCTTGDHCMGGKCVGGQTVQCHDNPPCKTNGKCNPNTGQCEYTFNDGVSCDDGNLCSTGGTCYQGECKGGSQVQCPNNPPCKINGHCNPSTGQCEYTMNNGTPCDDGDECTVNDKCSGGQCIAGTPYCTMHPCASGCYSLGCIVIFGPTCQCVCP